MSSPSFENHYARLPERFYSPVTPAKVPRPEIIKINGPLASALGIDPGSLESEDGLGMLSGNGVPEGAEPVAQAYAGHQFGGWVPQLGDGRAILLGELRHEDGSLRDLQLKGAGRTPYSRGGDGKAPLGPVLREYLVSEAMVALGVPTTRALAAVSTGELVYREESLPGAVLTRVASSHVRVGTFQFFYAREDVEALKTLADFVIERHYPEVAGEENPYPALLREVIKRQASLIARWMQLGFIHGVMNTDNMSVSGETIDFGPCAFMDTFHPETVFSSIDRQGRYAWINQPVAGSWNLARLAETLLPLFSEDRDEAVKIAEAEIHEFERIFNSAYFDGFADKLGIERDAENARALIERTLGLLAGSKLDFTVFFTCLTRFQESKDPADLPFAFEGDPDWSGWIDDWQELVADGGSGLERMRRSNPVVIPRNHQVEAAIEAAMQGDYSLFHRLNEALLNPYEEREEYRDLELPPQDDEKVVATFCGT
ncbi:MAG: YdiU family protein [Verrucomicrobiales bacterium]|nr:YdiU family protein [Verrucomicrobiales bacterium]